MQISDGEAADFANAVSRLRQAYGELGDNAFHLG